MTNTNAELIYLSLPRQQAVWLGYQLRLLAGEYLEREQSERWPCDQAEASSIVANAASLLEQIHRAIHRADMEDTAKAKELAS